MPYHCAMAVIWEGANERVEDIVGGFIGCKKVKHIGLVELFIILFYFYLFHLSYYILLCFYSFLQ